MTSGSKRWLSTFLDAVLGRRWPRILKGSTYLSWEWQSHSLNSFSTLAKLLAIQDIWAPIETAQSSHVFKLYVCLVTRVLADGQENGG
jgi:hypothetical protein